MCGIIGIIAKENNIIEDIIQGLKNLEYRGYDSAGLATIIDHKITTVKVKGKINFLEEEINKNNITSQNAIGHTRWATHGAPNETNAHPHSSEFASVVHNGIIENYLEIKSELQKLGHVFNSQTDSEVIPHLISHFIKQGKEPLNSVKEAVAKLSGAFSIAVIFPQQPEIIICARKGSPLVVGFSENKQIIASDPYAIAFLTNKIYYLEEGELAQLSKEKIDIFDINLTPKIPKIITINLTNNNLGKANYRHYMLKEIYEQPTILANTINAYYDLSSQKLNFANLKIDFSKITKISLIACGTSYYSAMIAKYWLETLLNIAIEVDMSSEFRYRDCYLPEKGLAIFLSQSGETADTLAALRHAKQKKQHTISIVNVSSSSLAREADYSLECFAGPEISVASTKGFTTQLTLLLLLSLHIANERKRISPDALSSALNAITEIPSRITESFNNIKNIQLIAKEIAQAETVLFIGRNYIYPVALEGALKLKELSYIHAEGIPAGELKHGPIALIDENVPVIILAPENQLFEKSFSNAQEVAARGAKIISFSSKEGNEYFKDLSKFTINISKSSSFIEPIIYVIPMQLLAYFVAVTKGTDVDQPRNLAKSVTVE